MTEAILAGAKRDRDPLMISAEARAETSSPGVAS